MVSYLEYSYRVTFVKALKVAIVATHAMREVAAHCFPCQQWVHDGLHAVHVLAFHSDGQRAKTFFLCFALLNFIYSVSFYIKHVRANE